MSPEQRLQNWFIQNAPANWHIQRIESSTGRGIPDANVCFGVGKECWIEFKRRHG